MKGLHIHSGYLPGAIGRITELHARYYHRYWDFGLFFERKVADGLTEFLGRFKKNRDGLWLSLSDDSIVGAIAIDGKSAEQEGAHLRWFIVDTDIQGSGIGRALIERAVSFCRQCRYPKIYLWTFQGLDAARHLYESSGFMLTREIMNDSWGKRVNEQLFEKEL